MDLRYPVGKFVFDKDVTPDKRRAWIRQLDALPRDVRNALAELPAEGLDTPYRDGGWTVRQVVHHLADSHSNAYTRIKLALTEATPALKTYEEQLWAELPDSKLDVAPSLAILDGIHTRLTIVLESLDARSVRTHRDASAVGPVDGGPAPADVRMAQPPPRRAHPAGESRSDAGV